MRTSLLGVALLLGGCWGAHERAPSVEPDEDAGARCETNEWFLDADGDGVGGASSALGCEPPPGYVALSGDCDDSAPEVGRIDDDEYENNDDDVMAAPIELGRYALRTCTSATGGRDQDWFRLPDLGARPRYMCVQAGPGENLLVSEHTYGTMFGGREVDGGTSFAFEVQPRTLRVRIRRRDEDTPRCSCGDYTLEVSDAPL